MTLSANQGTVSAHRLCPSLYAATRLARFVLRVKERLKARIKSRRLLTEPSVTCHQDNLDARVCNDAKYAIRARPRNIFVSLPYCKSKRVRVDEVQILTLLHELDTYTLPDDASMMMTAKQDELFLKQDAQKIAKANNREGLRHMFDLTALLLDRLQHSPHTYWPTPGRHNDNDKPSWTGFACPKTVANLEHLLRCLHQATCDALISEMLKAIEADVARWHQYWQQSKAIFEGWFSEWPNGQRPLNTTWPWNVKPSLVVLWGVCWMFFDHNPGRTRKPPPPPPPQQYPRSIGARRQLIMATQPSFPLENWNTRTDVAPFEPWSSPQNIFQVQVPLVPQAHVPGSFGISPPSFVDVPGTTEETHIPLTSTSTGVENLLRSSNILWSGISDPHFADLDFSINHLNPQTLETVLHTVGGRGGRKPHGQQRRPSNTEKERCQTELGLVVPPFNMRDYPSPYSEVSGSGISPCRPKTGDRPLMPDVSRSSAEGSPPPDRERSATIAEVEINEKGLYQCPHKDCANEPQEFSRKCEYTKHRDKHTRPYVCKEPGCEKILGFTYAGGLLRHEREVHRQHGGPKACYMCPHPNCKRSSGAGFSRKENLAEHLRRVHRNVGEERDPMTTLAAAAASGSGATFSTSPFLPNVNIQRKRRRSDDTEADSEDGGEEKGNLHNQIKAMRRDLENADERLKRLEKLVDKLSAGLRAAANVEV